jgi:hypothetical protein
VIGIVYPMVDVGLHNTPQGDLAVGVARAHALQPLGEVFEVLKSILKDGCGGPTEGDCPLDLLGRPRSGYLGAKDRPRGLQAATLPFNFSGLPAAVMKSPSSWVSVGPGQTALKVMPSRVCSRAIALEKATMPPLQAA